MAKDQPRFIRKNGRIIPVGGKKDKKGKSRSQDKPKTKPKAVAKKKEKKRSPFQLANAGLLSIIGSNAAAGVLAGKGAKAGEKADGLRRFGASLLATGNRPKGERMLRASMNSVKRSKGLFKLANAARFGGVLLGGSLASEGIERSLGKDSVEKGVAADVAGLAIATVASRAFGGAFRASGGSTALAKLRQRRRRRGN